MHNSKRPASAQVRKSSITAEDGAQKENTMKREAFK
jgi:hypothetical protein